MTPIDAPSPPPPSSALETLTAHPDTVLFLFIAAVVCVPLIGLFWMLVRNREEELRTVRELSQAGHSAEDIAMLVKQRGKDSPPPLG